MYPVTHCEVLLGLSQKAKKQFIVKFHTEGLFTLNIATVSSKHVDSKVHRWYMSQDSWLQKTESILSSFRELHSKDQCQDQSTGLGQV